MGSELQIRRPASFEARARRRKLQGASCDARAPQDDGERISRAAGKCRMDSMQSKNELARSRGGVEPLPRLLDGRAVLARPQPKLADRVEQRVAKPGQRVFDARRNGRVDRA